MLINCDVKSLEIVVAAELSGDKVLCQEIIDKVDTHEVNRLAFNLPSRLIAKIFVFRLLYGGSAYSYANDPDFMSVSRDQDFWQDVIDRFYIKYSGIAEWHKKIIETAQFTGRLEIPSGRFFPIVPDYRKRNPWPHTNIKNYPVQGYGADLVMLARLRARRLIIESGLEALLISTVHDSIVVDTPSKNVYNISKILKQSIEEVPSLCHRVFGHEFKLPLTCEIQVGPNKKEMKEIKIEN